MWVSSRITRVPVLAGDGFQRPTELEHRIAKTFRRDGSWSGRLRDHQHLNRLAGFKWKSLQNDFPMLPDGSLSPLCFHVISIEDSRSRDPTFGGPVSVLRSMIGMSYARRVLGRHADLSFLILVFLGGALSEWPTILREPRPTFQLPHPRLWPVRLVRRRKVF